ncbi:SLBB domain-containing protein [Acaryochloris sp. 'Moss Beach']|uniref:polysaccharide biosynthesis/export family protein n=1 Tax=Acaryochloris TaxID=155977 RepID=UPI001BAF9644|nr:MULTISPECIES: SLBB domain-containing protein [Acaryochloris]QUY41785.1 SLBB domain-containing protein [Acaryochloris marina S15]UJB70940.1 SLBB domain-containing protein [Acaryochloris sp. 'Moss Beach']
MIRPLHSAALIAIAASITPISAEAQVSTSEVNPASEVLTVAQNTLTPDRNALVNQQAYVLGAGDEIQLTMFGQPELFTSNYRVLVDGTVSLPLIGRVPVTGRSLGQAEREISLRYTRLYRRPYVTMVLVKARTVTLAVTGEVRRPGTYPVESPNQIPTVTQLIQLAGGTSQSADLSQIQVRRPQLNGRDQYITVDLMKLLQQGDLSQNLELRDKDTVIIPATAEVDFTNSLLVSNASFSADRSEPINVAIIGQVYRPGPHTIRPGSADVQDAGTLGNSRAASSELPTVTQAIQTAGGIKPEADIRKVQILRRPHNGTQQEIDVDLWKLLKEGDLSQDIALQAGDTIVVPKAVGLTAAEITELSTISFAPATIDVNVVGEVKRPGVVKIQPNTPLNTAMLAAGGFDDSRANKSKVKLIRLNPNGTVTQREIKIDFEEPLNEEKNPALRNNDVIVVGRSGITRIGDGLRNVLSPITSGFGIFRLLF